MNIEIRIAEIADIENSVEILAISFLNDPALTWLVDDADERFKVLSDYFRVFMALGINKGTVHIAEIKGMGMVGVSIWCPPDAEDEDFENELVRFAGVHAPRFLQYGEITHAHYPPADNYYKLALVAIHPAAQGKGIGTALMYHQLDELDRIGMPTYLEASTRLSAGGLYERAGYQPVGRPIRFPSGEEIYPLWRNPHEVALSNPEQEIDGVDAGSLVKFAGYDWCVLDVQSDKALMICENIIEQRKFHEHYEAVTWEASSLRKYLNEDFFQTFATEEQSEIISVKISNNNNQWFGTDCGNDTTDKIFLLDIEGAVKYFGDSRQLRHKNKNTKYFISDDFNTDRIAVNGDKLPNSWWLRSSGSIPKFAATITIDGRISIGGDFVNRMNTLESGVRPAMWVNLQVLNIGGAS